MAKGTKIRKSESCTPANFAKRAIKVNKMSSVKSPFSSGNMVADKAVNKIPAVGYFNKGFSLGSKAFVIKQTYDDLCRE